MSNPATATTAATVADAVASTIATAAATAAATATKPATMGELKAAHADIFAAPSLARLASSGREEVSSLSALREWIACAHSGTQPEPLPEKAVKGSALPLALCKALRALAPKPNTHRGATLAQWAEIIEEWTFSAATAGLKPAATKTEKTELEKARAYIAKLSPETIAALREEGVI